jgi:hypothetical protein
MPKRPDGLLRSFGMSGFQILADLSGVEKDFDIEIQQRSLEKRSRKSAEFEQFEADIRRESARMSEYYEVFYCLENSIRRLVNNVLADAEGTKWWTSNRVDKSRIRDQAEPRRRKEIDSAISPRSDNMIDYTTFGELSQLITDNWDLFDTIFTSKSAVSRITNDLNILRGPIAHCSPTDELEQERLNLAVKTWFRIMS